jgi:hypothetical protein
MRSATLETLQTVFLNPARRSQLPKNYQDFKVKVEKQNPIYTTEVFISSLHPPATELK